MTLVCDLVVSTGASSQFCSAAVCINASSAALWHYMCNVYLERLATYHKRPCEPPQSVHCDHRATSACHTLHPLGLPFHSYHYTMTAVTMLC
jgi:hypothetical protein